MTVPDQCAKIKGKNVPHFKHLKTIWYFSFSYTVLMYYESNVIGFNHFVSAGGVFTYHLKKLKFVGNAIINF